MLTRVFRAFKYRDFRLMWLGACTSSIGTWMQKLAQAWLVFELSKSPFLLGLDAFLAELPIFLFSLVGGAIADRHDRRHLLLFSQYVQMACAFALALLVALGQVQVWHILALSFVSGFGQAFGAPAYQALLPSLVPLKDLSNAIALNSIQFNLARVVGPVLGGLALAHAGAAWCFGLNGLSFIPVIVIRGAKPGPVAAFLAGVHGGEYVGIETLLRVSRDLKPADLSGTVVLLPIVNMPAFQERRPFVCPLDGKNLNRVFPGRRDGTFSEVLAAVVMDEVVSRVDCLVDLHGGDLVEALTPFCLYQLTGKDEVDRGSIELARAFDLPIIGAVRGRGGAWASDGTLVAAAAGRGVPAVIAEVGGQGHLTEDDVERHRHGVMNVLRQVGMLPGWPALTAAPTLVSDMVWPRSDLDGIFYPHVKVGERVRAGTVIGTLHDYFGGLIKPVHSPANGLVMFVTTSPAVLRDGPLMGIGVLEG